MSDPFIFWCLSSMFFSPILYVSISLHNNLIANRIRELKSLQAHEEKLIAWDRQNSLPFDKEDIKRFSNMLVPFDFQMFLTVICFIPFASYLVMALFAVVCSYNLLEMIVFSLSGSIKFLQKYPDFVIKNLNRIFPC